MSPIDELRQAAHHIREGAAGGCGCRICHIFLAYPAAARQLADELERCGQPLGTVNLAVARAINAAVPATSRTVICRSDCAEIPGYCSSGIGCLGSAPSSPSTPEEPA